MVFEVLFPNPGAVRGQLEGRGSFSFLLMPLSEGGARLNPVARFLVCSGWLGGRCPKVLNVKMDTYKGVYVGVRNVLMEVTTPIPSSLKIAEHWVNVFYPGQTSTCFACRQSDHTRANCPRAIAPVIPADDAAADETVPPLLSPARDDIVKTLMGSVVDRVVDHTHAIPPQAPLSFAEATQRGLDHRIGKEQKAHSFDLFDATATSRGGWTSN